jgi:hypothetical protein
MSDRSTAIPAVRAGLESERSMDDENARAAQARKGSPFLNAAQAALYVGLSPRTLEKMRTLGGGPRFRKHGRYVRYHIADLDAWSCDAARRTTRDG